MKDFTRLVGKTVVFYRDHMIIQDNGIWIVRGPVLNDELAMKNFPSLDTVYNRIDKAIVGWF